jgi:hypothetical protein
MAAMSRRSSFKAPKPVRGSQVRHNGSLVANLKAFCSSMNLTRFAASMREVLQEEAWRERYVMELAPGQIIRFESFQVFVTTAYPRGLGEDPERLGKLLEADPATRRLYYRALGALAGHGGDRRREKTKVDQVDNVKLNPGGNQAAYLARRLNRDHPEIADQFAKGAYRSVRAAAIAAGILIPPSPLHLAQRAYLRLTAEEREQFARWLAEKRIERISDK